VETLALRRLSEFAVPTAHELSALEGAKQARREFRRNQIISRQGDPVREVYFVADGWVGSSLEVNSGRKQLAKIYMPGDLAGLPNIATTRATSSLVALTNVTVDVIPVKNLAQLFEQASRLGFMLFVASQQERVLLMDQLAVVGQTSAIQRVAAFLVHVHRRLTVLRPEAGLVIDWPISQQRVAEGAGLTAIHVNRTFRELTRRGLIMREGKKIRLLDLAQLCELAGLPDHVFIRNPSWLAGYCGGV
jgi:CRP-like cAMP-binding protein